MDDMLAIKDEEMPEDPAEETIERTIKESAKLTHTLSRHSNDKGYIQIFTKEFIKSPDNPENILSFLTQVYNTYIRRYVQEIRKLPALSPTKIGNNYIRIMYKTAQTQWNIKKPYDHPFLDRALNTQIEFKEFFEMVHPNLLAALEENIAGVPAEFRFTPDNPRFSINLPSNFAVSGSSTQPPIPLDETGERPSKKPKKSSSNNKDPPLNPTNSSKGKDPPLNPPDPSSNSSPLPLIAASRVLVYAVLKMRDYMRLLRRMNYLGKLYGVQKDISFVKISNVNGVQLNHSYPRINQMAALKKDMVRAMGIKKLTVVKERNVPLTIE